MQIPDHLRGAIVGEGYVHYGGVYAPLGHPLARFPNAPGLGDDLEVGLLIHQVGGGLAEGCVVLDEEDEGHLCMS